MKDEAEAQRYTLVCASIPTKYFAKFTLFI